jgi:hypothetical protein
VKALDDAVYRHPLALKVGSEAGQEADERYQRRRARADALLVPAAGVADYVDGRVVHVQRLQHRQRVGREHVVVVVVAWHLQSSKNVGRRAPRVSGAVAPHASSNDVARLSPATHFKVCELPSSVRTDAASVCAMTSIDICSVTRASPPVRLRD